MKIVVSACLLGHNCKYNGGNNLDPHVLAYVEDREVIPVCPEECLGMPRIPMEIKDGILVNREGQVVDGVIREQVTRILTRLKGEQIDCCILKSRSPTCGVRQVYDGTFTGTLVEGMGVLAQALRHAGYLVIDAEDLSDFCFRAGELKIRPLSQGDEAAMAELFTDPLVERFYMIPDLPDEAAVKALFARLLKMSRDRSRFVAGVYRNGECIGLLNETERTEDEIELGLALRSGFHGRGYGTAVLKAAGDFFLGRGFREVLAGAFEENQASIRAMEKSGMTRLERRDSVTYRGKTHECVYYARRK